MSTLPKLTLAALAAVLLTGCGLFATKPSPKPAPPAEPTNIAKDFRTTQELKPDAAPPAEANLILNGTVIPVTLKEQREGNSVTYSWIVDAAKESGQPVVVETEKYFFSKDVFSFAAASHEKYDPPISLIRYPLTVGNAWDWAGSVITGKNKTAAKATITTSADTLNLPSEKLSALLVTVDLTYDGQSAPAKRELKFWFKPGEGLIRRSLWGSSTREPRSDTENSGPE